MRIVDLNISVLTTHRGYTKLYHLSLIYEKRKGNFIVTSVLANLMVELSEKQVKLLNVYKKAKKILQKLSGWHGRPWRKPETLQE